MKTLLVFLILASSIILHASCGAKGDAAKAAESLYTDRYPLPEDALSVDVTGHHGGRIVTATFAEPKTFNQLLFDDTDSQTYNQLMSPGLTRLNLLTQQIEPALSKSWDVSEDHLNWTFHLRKGLKWSDGHPFSAADVLFTMQIVNDRSIPSGAQDALTVDGKSILWKQLDDHTVTAQLPAPHVTFLRSLDAITTPIIAKHKWEAAYRAGKFQQTMQVSMKSDDFVGIGAFRLKEYRPGEKVVLIRNPHYWKKDRSGRRLPYLDELIFLITASQDQVQLKLESGEIDTYFSIRPGDVQRMEQKAASLRMKVYNLGPAYDYEGLFFNQNAGKNPKTGRYYVNPRKRAWFTDVNFRRAVSHAINRQELVQNAVFGRAVPSYGMESTSNRFWYNHSIPKYSYGPEKALQLLNSSGFTLKQDSNGKSQLFDRQGNPVRFALHTNAGNSIRNMECTLIVRDLAKIGMQVDYSPQDFNSLITKITDSYDFDAILTGLSHDDVDPSSSVNVLRSSGSLHLWWPQQKQPQTAWEKRIDELMTLQLSTFDLNARKKHYDELQVILAEQQPIVFTVNPLIYVCGRDSLLNLKPSISRHRTLWNADELSWAQKL